MCLSGRCAFASRTRLSVAPCASWSPWLKLRRAVFMPASMSVSSVGTSQHAGPIVQKIFVFFWTGIVDCERRAAARGAVSI